MIDWYTLAANSLWVIGLAWLIAVLSWHHAAGVPWFSRDDRSIYLAILLFCLGLALSTTEVWARILWGLLAFLNLAGMMGWFPRFEQLFRQGKK